MTEGGDAEAKEWLQGRCVFEWLYFASPNSYVEGRSVYSVREKLGALLGRKEKEEIDIAIPAPDSGRSAVVGYAEALTERRFIEKLIGKTVTFDDAKIKELLDAIAWYKDGFYKSPYTTRTFQVGDKEERYATIDVKLAPNKEVVKNRSIAYIDDSIVRLSTNTRAVARLRRKGAKEVHVRITTPPILSFCPLGIDMRTKQELVARRKLEEVMSSMSDISVARLPYSVVDKILVAGSVEAAADELGIDADHLRSAMEEANERMVESVCDEMGADSLTYTTIDELVEAINMVPARPGAPEKLPYDKLCTGCLGGRYPLERSIVERLLKSDGGGGRAWEQKASARKADTPKK
jgi:glutamine phosphoribosylpyrophosphate amidotransferase